ncbi:MAG: glutathione S-transferase [Hyphomicrobiales bacterium]
MLDAKDTPVLYTFRRCPYAMRARMGIYASGIKMEWRELVLRDKPEHMVEISPKATVPVVQTPDGTVIDESFDVMVWALGQNDPHDWLPLNAEMKQRSDELIEECDTSFKHHLDRYKYPNRYEGVDAIESRDAAVEILTKWNGYLARHENLLGDKPRLADYATFPFVRQFANVNRDWFDGLDLPHLQAWLERHLTSKIFADIMLKQKPWKPDDELLIFPQEAKMEEAAD